MPYPGFEHRTSRTPDRWRTNRLRHGRSAPFIYELRFNNITARIEASPDVVIHVAFSRAPETSLQGCAITVACYVGVKRDMQTRERLPLYPPPFSSAQSNFSSGYCLRSSFEGQLRLPISRLDTGAYCYCRIFKVTPTNLFFSTPLNEMKMSYGTERPLGDMALTREATLEMTDPKEKFSTLWLDYSPPTKANRIRFPMGPTPGVRMWESCRRWSAGFLENLPFPRALAFRRCSINHLALPSSALKTSMLRAARISSLTLSGTLHMKGLAWSALYTAEPYRPMRKVPYAWQTPFAADTLFRLKRAFKGAKTIVNNHCCEACQLELGVDSVRGVQVKWLQHDPPSSEPRLPSASLLRPGVVRARGAHFDAATVSLCAESTNNSWRIVEWVFQRSEEGQLRPWHGEVIRLETRVLVNCWSGREEMM
ncbi:hypothetical protein PR048_027092 [Dryococelus australis]|uniref:Ig-like domain-containing protein n=1 Tax=Dryococelus australis TaxID=614101 RepID=A0ABQ9GG74_9NEOP|nr:hypothetical protein PR048_027092 [Dryococelus australis]